MTRGHIAARMLRPLAWHHMDLRGRLMWLAMLPVLIFATVWGVYVVRQRAADLALVVHGLRAQTVAQNQPIYGAGARLAAHLPRRQLMAGMLRQAGRIWIASVP